MKKAVCSLLCVWLLLCIPLTALADTADILVTGGKPYKLIVLTPEVYNRANANLSDLRIWDENGAEVPYVRHGGDAFLSGITPVFTVTEVGNETEIAISNMRHVRIRTVTIATDDTFQRKVSFGDGQLTTLYNLPIGDAPDSSLTIEFEGWYTTEDNLVLRIQNQNDRPITITGLTVESEAEALIFAGEANKTYKLTFGDASLTRAPVYDIAGYKELVLAEGYDLLPLSGVQADEPAPEEPAGLPLETIMNIVLVLVAGLLCVVILLRLRKKKDDKDKTEA